MPENDFRVPFNRPAALNELGIDKVSAQSSIQINGRDELAKELVRSRSIEAVASSLASLGPDAIAAEDGIRFGLVIET